MFINYKITQDEDGYYREVLSKGRVSSRRFRSKESLGSWVAWRSRLEAYGLLLAICLVFVLISRAYEAIVKLFGGQ